MSRKGGTGRVHQKGAGSMAVSAWDWPQKALGWSWVGHPLHELAKKSALALYRESISGNEAFLLSVVRVTNM